MANLLIPRVFHQIWLGTKPIPEPFQKWSKFWLSLNPGWKLELWTDQHLPNIINKKEFDAADKMAAKSDILRYELIAQFGGIYIDSDFEPLKPIEELLTGVNAFYGDERPDTPCNAILGCTPNDPFFTHLVKNLPESFAGPGDIVDKTGPRFLKKEIEKFFGPNRKTEWDADFPRRAKISAENKSLHAFDWRIFYPYYYTEEQRGGDAFPDAYGKHHWTASWWKNGGV